MIIVNEKKVALIRSPAIKNSLEVIAIFSKIESIFSGIFIELSQLNMIFISENWNLKEIQKESLAIYQERAKNIRDYLTNIESLNAGLVRFLASSERPIPIKKSAPEAIDIHLEGIEKQFKFYYNEVKGTSFPKLDKEVKRCKAVIQRINENINRINEINALHGRKPIKNVKELSI